MGGEIVHLMISWVYHSPGQAALFPAPTARWGSPEGKTPWFSGWGNPSKDKIRLAWFSFEPPHQFFVKQGCISSKAKSKVLTGYLAPFLSVANNILHKLLLKQGFPAEERKPHCGGGGVYQQKINYGLSNLIIR